MRLNMISLLRGSINLMEDRAREGEKVVVTHDRL